MNPTLVWLKNLLVGNVVVIELALLLFSSISILLFYFNFSSSNLFLVISVNLAVFLYFFVATIEFEGNQISKLSYRVILIGFSVAFLGTLFKFQDYPGAERMLNLGVFSMCLVLLAYVFNNRRNWSNNLLPLAVRVTLIATLGLVMWLL